MLFNNLSKNLKKKEKVLTTVNRGRSSLFPGKAFQKTH